MEKKYFLSVGDITKRFYLDRGAFDRNRIDLGKLDARNFLEALKTELNLHKAFELYVSLNISEEYLKDLSKLLKNTQIKMFVKKDLRQI